MRRAAALFALCLATCSIPGRPAVGPGGVDTGQVPGWTREDLDFYLNGSMSSEFMPVRLMRALIAANPDLFPNGDFSAFDVIDGGSHGWPIGFSVRRTPYQANQECLGINCAACHVCEVREAADKPPRRILGGTAHFNSQAWAGAVVVSMLRVPQMDRLPGFLQAYLRAGHPDAETGVLDRALAAQHDAIAAELAADPSGAGGLAPDALHDIAPGDLYLSPRMLDGEADLVRLVRAILRIFHNARAALHVPFDLPAGPVPLFGPGRTDAWGTLARTLLGLPSRDDAATKYGLAWDGFDRYWVHMDGNNRDALARNLGAVFGLGAPLVGDRGVADMNVVHRMTRLAHEIRHPAYPWGRDRQAARRGAAVYATRCASCHDVAEGERLRPATEVGTDPNRVNLVNQEYVDRLNAFYGRLQADGYASRNDYFRYTGGMYWSPSLDGVWARAPYLHNGSVRTMWDLLTPASQRPRSWHRGSRIYDPAAMGFMDDGSFVFDTTLSGNSNAGHDYGTDLTEQDKRDLIEYLKTR